jgi:hypothetical protein
MTELEQMDNATLMKNVQEIRRVLWESKSQGKVYPATWTLLKRMKSAEKLMRSRNLPLDHPALGARFTNAEIADYLVIEGEAPEPSPAPAPESDFSGRTA